MTTTARRQDRMRQSLRDFDFKTLFIEELGWDDDNRKVSGIEVDGTYFDITAIAEKSGWIVFECGPDANGNIPLSPDRKKIERQVRKQYHEHSIIYVDRERTVCVWQWIKHEPGKPAASRENEFHRGQTGEALLQKLNDIRVSLDEDPTIVDIVQKYARGFDVDKVTKKFYDRFKKEHDGFLTFIEGIPGEDDRRWYASVMLNRLMFIYFVQRREFLDSDPDYLRTKLDEVRAVKGEGKFHSFYRDFLLALFHDGLGSAPPRDPEIQRLIGDIPYLNGGIFDPHALEQEHSGIEIADEAFEAIFDFFDEYQWHLDDRPLSDDKQINPDVLGYIFEKYINQKQMGAYYTKEDITGYISRNTIIPYLFDAARKECAIAFRPDGNVWTLLSENPDEYIYDAVKKGTDLPLPEDIAAGIGDVTQRTGWNRPADPDYALPTEIWREHVARRQRYEEVWEKLVGGEVQSIDDLITLNLNIEQFAQDAIENCEGPDLLRAFYKAISSVSVLDPTCGSGAFLFAALNILEPLYSACLERMRAFIDDLERSPEKSSPAKYSDFRDTLRQVADHPNEKYFILKSIIVNNLYGVDIMEEAVEICKLRLFLKLASELDTGQKIEPLPDIDFNIRSGNTLVGFASLDDVTDALSRKRQGQTTLVDPETEQLITSIKHQAEDIDSLLRHFRQQQTEIGGAVTSLDKQELTSRLKMLTDRLDRYLARRYGIDNLNYRKDALEAVYEKWYRSHQPFHWFAEFHGIAASGGFNVIIGNPPYIEYSKVKNEYQVFDYETLSCGNLYGYVIERSFRVSCSGARNGMIIQLPIVCTDRMIPLQQLISNDTVSVWLSSFDDRPARLFEGLEHIRATVMLGHVKSTSSHTVFTTHYNRWYSEARDVLFSTLEYSVPDHWSYIGAIPKVGRDIDALIISKIGSRKALGVAIPGPHKIYYHNAPQYWIRAMTYAPYFWNERDGEQLSKQVKTLSFASVSDAKVAASALNSSLFYWWFILLSDCRHLNVREIDRFPLGISEFIDVHKERLAVICDELMVDLQKHAHRKHARYATTGRVTYDEYYPRHSKLIIDQIDHILAEHFGFSEDEYDYIINYDIKYRMGQEWLEANV